jgi:hypothetical protein
MDKKLAAVAALATLSLAAVAPQAAAADNGFYLGAGITDSEFDIGGTDGSLDDNSFKIIAGWRPLDFLAVEANYIDLGSENEDGFEIDASAITVSGLLLAEIGIIDLYARLGFANWNVDATVPGVGSASLDDWEPTYGAGVGVHFGSIGARLEYETFEAGDLDADVNTLSLSVTYTFL